MTRITKKRIHKSSNKRKSIRRNYRGSGIKELIGKMFRKKPIQTQTQMEHNIPQQPPVKKSSRIGRFFKGFKNVFTKKKQQNGVAPPLEQTQEPQAVYQPRMINTKNSGLNSIGVPYNDLKQIPGYLELKEIRTVLNDKKISEDEQTAILLSQYTKYIEPPFTKEDLIRIQNSTDPRSKTLLKPFVDNISEQISKFLKEEKLRQYPRLFIGNGYNNRAKSSNYLTFVKNVKFLLSVFKLVQQRFFTNTIYPIDNINNSNLIINNHIRNLMKPRQKAFIKAIILNTNIKYPQINQLSRNGTSGINENNIIEFLKKFELINESVEELPSGKQGLKDISKLVTDKLTEFKKNTETIKKLTNDDINNAEKAELLKNRNFLENEITKMFYFFKNRILYYREPKPRID
jgi:hypothetical protein